VGEAREVTESLTPQTRDVIIRDVFAGALTPRPLTTAEFNGHANRVLAPGGIGIRRITPEAADGPSLTTVPDTLQSRVTSDPLGKV